MRAARALTVLLVIVGPNVARAEDPAQIDRLALEGRWSEAQAAWHRWLLPMGLGRSDLSGAEIDFSRTAWSIEADGRAMLLQDGVCAEVRQAAHRLAARGEDPSAGASGIFPVLEALYAERMIRETRGMGDLPTGSPLAGLPDPDGTVARFLAWQAEVYRPTPAEQSSDAAWAAQARASREQAESLRSSAHLWAALAAGLLLLFTWVVGRSLKPTERDAS